MKRELFRLVLGLGLTFMAAGCGNGGAGQLGESEALTIYSIEGKDKPTYGKEKPEAKKNQGEEFQGYPVQGKLEITDAAKRKEIIDAINEGIAKSDGGQAKCFWPRHAIRSVEKGKTVDYVICFECYQLQRHLNGHYVTITTTRSPQSVLNKHLKDANVPLSPGMKD